MCIAKNRRSGRERPGRDERDTRGRLEASKPPTPRPAAADSLSLDAMERMEALALCDAALCRRLAQAQWRAGKREAAYMTLEAALRKIGPEPSLYVHLGLFHAAEEDFAGARASFTRAVELDSTNADAFRWLGLACAAAGDPAGAVEFLQKAVDLRGDDLPLLKELAMAAVAAKNAGHPVTIRLPHSPHKTVRPSLAELVEREDGLGDALAAAAESSGDRELLKRLAAVLAEAVKAHPGYVDLRLELCGALRGLGRLDEAITQAREAVRANPRFLRARAVLADLCEETGESADVRAA